MALDPTVIVAGIAAAGAVGSAWVGRQRHQEVQQIRRTLGDINGHGNAMQMLEVIQNWIILHETRHANDDQRAQRQLDDLWRTLCPEQRNKLA